MSNDSRKQEQRARRMAATCGYFVQKSRQQYSGNNLGQYRLVDADMNVIVLGERFDASPDEIISFLTE